MAPVIFLLKDFPVGGIEMAFSRLALALSDRGHSVSLVILAATKAERARAAAAVGEDVTIKVISLLDTEESARPDYPTLLLGLLRFLRDQPAGVIISAKEQANFAAVLAKVRYRGKFKAFISRHVPLLNPVAREEATWLSRFLYQSGFYALADQIIAVSREIRDELLITKSRYAGRVRLLYNPVIDERLFEKAALPLPAELQSKIANRFLIVSVGRLHAQKGHDLLIEAFHRAGVGERACLLIIGEGPARGALESQVRKLGITGRVSLPGNAGNPYPYMRLAHCVAFASRYEGMPTTLIEALALNGNVIASDCPTGPREIIEKFGRGTLFQSGNVEELARLLRARVEAGIPVTTEQSAREPESRIPPEFEVQAAAAAYEKMLGG